MNARDPVAAAAVPSNEALYAAIERAAQRLEGVAHRTPLLTSRTLDALVGKQVFVKPENLQRVGAFKFRGAYNAMANLTDAQRARGVIAESSGNHAQAVACVANMHGIAATLVMPSFAPAIKLAATRGYGADIVHYDLAGEDREAMAQRLATERGLTLIPPFDHIDVITGQGTAGLELFDDAGPLDALVVPVGGGGLISGCSVVAKHRHPACQVIGVEPAAGNDGQRSFEAGELIRHTCGNTIADGARVPSLGRLTFAVIQRNVAAMTTVPDEALIEAMRFVWQRMKVIVEPTGVLALAALMSGVVEPEGERVGVVLSGGNVDLAHAARWFAQDETPRSS